MTSKYDKQDAGKKHDLRQEAMQRLRNHQPDISAMATKDVASLIHELEVYQIELEVQNEELRRSQVELEDARNMYFDLYELAPVGYLTLDAHGIIRQANLAASELCGIERDKLVGACFEKLVAEEDRDKCYMFLRQAAKSDRVHQGEFRVANPDSRLVWVSVEAAKLPASGDHPQGFRVTLSDITLQKQTSAELEIKVQDRTVELHDKNVELGARAEQLRRLTSEMTLTGERERQRLAHVLHDHLQQLLVAAKMDLNYLFGELKDHSEQHLVSRVINVINESIKESRSLTTELSPPILHEAGLAAGLKWLARVVKEKNGLEVELELSPEADIKKEDISILLFQSVRELLFNIVKHSGVRRAKVSLKKDAEGIILIVIDAGGGFDVEQMWKKTAAQTSGGFGLFSIKERIHLMGGEFVIRSEKGKGAEFIIKVPVE